MRITTYWPQLSLLQCHDGEKAVIVDGLAEDINSYKEVLLNPNVIKVIHSARQDLEIFYQLWGEIVQPIFDTQIAARFCGMGQSLSLSQLVKDTLQVELEKDVQFSNWLHRPLTDCQIAYAKQDVTYLIPLYNILKNRLEEGHQYSEFIKEQEKLLAPEVYQVQPDKAWLKVKGAKSLSKSQTLWVKVIAAWREQEAVRHNKIRKLILPDELLIRIAQRKPQSQEKLANTVKKLSSHQIQGLWEALLENKAEVF